MKYILRYNMYAAANLQDITVSSTCIGDSKTTKTTRKKIYKFLVHANIARNENQDCKSALHSDTDYISIIIS